jgi:hypothetical protein
MVTEFIEVSSSTWLTMYSMYHISAGSMYHISAWLPSLPRQAQCSTFHLFPFPLNLSIFNFSIFNFSIFNLFPFSPFSVFCLGG